MKKENSNPNGNQLPGRKKPCIPYRDILTGAAAFACSFTLLPIQALAADAAPAADMWGQAETIHGHDRFLSMAVRQRLLPDFRIQAVLPVCG